MERGAWQYSPWGRKKGDTIEVAKPAHTAVSDTKV